MALTALDPLLCENVGQTTDQLPDGALDTWFRDRIVEGVTAAGIVASPFVGWSGGNGNGSMLGRSLVWLGGVALARPAIRWVADFILLSGTRWEIKRDQGVWCINSAESKLGASLEGRIHNIFLRFEFRGFPTTHTTGVVGQRALSCNILRALITSDAQVSNTTALRLDKDWERGNPASGAKIEGWRRLLNCASTV